MIEYMFSVQAGKLIARNPNMDYGRVCICVCLAYFMVKNRPNHGQRNNVSIVHKEEINRKWVRKHEIFQWISGNPNLEIMHAFIGTLLMRLIHDFLLIKQTWHILIDRCEKICNKSTMQTSQQANADLFRPNEANPISPNNNIKVPFKFRRRPFVVRTVAVYRWLPLLLSSSPLLRACNVHLHFVCLSGGL